MRYYQFRMQLRRLSRRKPEHAAIIKQALDNEEVCLEACAWMEDKMASNPTGRFEEIMQFLFDHVDELAKLLKMLIDAFMAEKATVA